MKINDNNCLLYLKYIVIFFCNKILIIIKLIFQLIDTMLYNKKINKEIIINILMNFNFYYTKLQYFLKFK